MELFCRNRGTCRWDRSLRTLLLTAFLGFRIQLASGQGPITTEVGATVTFQITVTGTIINYAWYRGAAVGTNDELILWFQGTNLPLFEGSRYTGRESLLPDGSLQIKNVQRNDTGNYTGNIGVLNQGFKTFTRQLTVYEVGGSSDSGIGGGAIAGIVIAVVVVLIVVAVIIWYFAFKHPASSAKKDEHVDRNGASPPSSPHAPASGKANGQPADDVQYTTVKFAPKTEKVTIPAAPADTVYSEVRRK